MILIQLVWYHWLIIGLSIFVFVSLIVGASLIIETARRVYLHTLSKRMSKIPWGRNCSAPNNPEQVKMWNDGIAYMKQFEDKKHEVQIVNDGLKLFAEYYDFGGKKTALFLCGRCECLIYAYFYAKPYVESGYNLLFIDQRAHGLSEGEFSTVGIKESEDVLAWMKYIKETFKQESFTLHCVCVGGSCGLLATTSDKNDHYVEKVIMDGLFINFKDSYRRHYVDLGHRVFPVFHLIWMWFKIYTGVSVKVSSPYNCVKKLDVPILFIHSRNDKYSIPENAQILFDITKTNDKEIVWFDYGSHSHIRNVDPEAYDAVVKKFLTK